jgi:hypothetical protein
VAELRRDIEGGADHWSVRHDVEEGGGSARRDTAAHVGRQRCSVGSRMKKGVAPPPPGGSVGPHGTRKPTGRLG